jgi:hypothetical protein
VIGIRTGNVPGDISPTYAGTVAEDLLRYVIGDPAVGNTVGGGGADFTASPGPTTLTNVSATLESPDTTAPETNLVRGPRGRIRRHRVRFAFSSNEPDATFECKLDARPFRSCSSPKRYRVRTGRHRFMLRTTDAAGNSSSASHRFRVVEA